MKSKSRAKVSGKGCVANEKAVSTSSSAATSDHADDEELDFYPRPQELASYELDRSSRLKAFAERDKESRNKVNTEEMDPLQHDLENMLMRVVGRARLLRRAIDALDGKSPDAASTTGDKASAANKASSSGGTSSRRRGKGKGKDDAIVTAAAASLEELDVIEAEQTPRSHDPSSSASSTTSSISAVSSPSRAYLPYPVSKDGTTPMPEGLSSGPSCSKMTPGHSGSRRRFRWFFPANDFPDRFWGFVNDYCAPCTQEDVTYLESLSKQCDENEPKDGNAADTKHGIKREETPDRIVGTKRRRSSAREGSPPPAPGKRQRRLSSKRNDQSSTLANGTVPPATANGSSDLGPLTERLIQAFLEESASPLGTHHHYHHHSPNHHHHGSATYQNGSSDSVRQGSNGFLCSPTSIMKTLNMSNLRAIEHRIHKELLDHGLLEEEASESSEADSEDEVSTELRQRQDELRELQSNLKPWIDRLLLAVRSDLKRSELKQKLGEMDTHVADYCEKFCQSHPHKKPLKKEKDHIAKVLKDRREMLKDVDQLPWKW